MKITTGNSIRGFAVLIGGAIIYISSFIKEATALAISGVSLISIGSVAILAHSILARKSFNKKTLAFASIAASCVGGVGTALTDWNPDNTTIPWFFFIYAGFGLLLSLPGLDTRREDR